MNGVFIMTEPKVSLSWLDSNQIEKGHRVYRSDNPMDINNLPTPIVDLDKNIQDYVDYDVIDGNYYYYRVSAYIDGYEEISEEVYVKAASSTVDVHDVFGDGSAIATYPFDGDVNDLGGNYDLTLVSGSENYIYSGIDRSFNFDGQTQLRISQTIEFNDGITYSFWSNNLPSSVELLLEGSNTGMIMLHTNIGGFRFNGMQIGSEIDFNVDKSGNNHWVFTSSLNDIMLYKNGVLVGTQLIAGSSLTTNYINIGARNGLYNLNGDIDQLRIFNRPLTQNEVDILYQEGLS